MPNSPITSPAPPEVTLTETASAALADLTDLAAQLPGDTARNAVILDRLAEELTETAAMLRALPSRPAAMTGHSYGALSAFRTAVASGEDIGEFIALTLTRLAAEVGGTSKVIANRPGSWEASHVADLLSGTVGPDDENLGAYRTTQ
jgi:malonyl CoA-acyl carrier protein transacylase